MNGIGGFVDIEDSRPLPGLEWRVDINREEAARYGADVATLGAAVQMLTTGLLVAEYTPDDADEEIDIRMRFPAEERNLDQLLQIRVPTALGHIPVKTSSSSTPPRKPEPSPVWTAIWPSPCNPTSPKGCW